MWFEFVRFGKVFNEMYCVCFLFENVNWVSFIGYIVYMFVIDEKKWGSVIKYFVGVVLLIFIGDSYE